MPIWAPPTPPQDDNDLWMDQVMTFLYEPTVMTESQLPPVYVRKDHRKPRVETITTRKQKQRKEEAPRVPRSLFDRPNSALVKMRREIKMQRLKAGIGLKQAVRPNTLPTQLTPKVPIVPESDGHPEWLIHEDWALLQAVSSCCQLPLNLQSYQNGHIANWDLIADVVNNVSRVHRSIKQCRSRYENVIVPREEGKILYDMSPRKQKKNKSTYKTKSNRPMKTSQLVTQDSHNSTTLLYSRKFDTAKSMVSKRPAAIRSSLGALNQKSSKHLVVMQEQGLSYEQPMNPGQVAAARAERIAREKRANAALHTNEAAQRPVQQAAAAIERITPGLVQAIPGVAAPVAATVAQAVTGQQLHSIVSASTPTTIIAGTSAPRAPVAQAMAAVSIARPIAAASNIVAVTGSLGRGQRVAVHDITTVAGTVTGAQVAAQTAVRATLQPTATASANLTQKMAAMTAAGATLSGATVHPQLAKGLTHQQINLLRPIGRSQTPGTATQAQQLRAQKLSLTNTSPQGNVRPVVSVISVDDLNKMVERKGKSQGRGRSDSSPAGQVCPQSLLQRMPQQLQTKQGALVRTMPTGLTEEQVKAFKVRHLTQKSVGGQQVKLQAAQILQGQMQPVGQSGSTSSAPVTLVKSAPAGAIPVSINVTMGQGAQKAALPSRGPTVSQLQHQRMQVFQKKTGVALSPSQRVTALTGGVRGHIPLIIPQKGPLTGQLLHQFVKPQQIISTSQPAIISVTQAQTLTPTMVAKVSLTTVPHTTPIHTLSAAAGSPITVNQVAAATPSSGGTGSHHTPTVATINMANVAAASHTSVVKTVDPSQQQTAAPKLATIPQSLVAQPLQIASGTLQPQQQGAQGQAVLTAAGTQHRVLTATPTTLPQATAVVVSATSHAAGQPTVSSMIQQQQQQQAASQQIVGAQAVATPTQSPQATQAQPATSQLTAQQQQQLQKASPYTMRTRNQPKH